MAVRPADFLPSFQWLVLPKSLRRPRPLGRWVLQEGATHVEAQKAIFPCILQHQEGPACPHPIPVMVYRGSDLLAAGMAGPVVIWSCLVGPSNEILYMQPVHRCRPPALAL